MNYRAALNYKFTTDFKGFKSCKYCLESALGQTRRQGVYSFFTNKAFPTVRLSVQSFDNAYYLNVKI